MGFLHAEDIMGKGTLKEKLSPKQKISCSGCKKNQQGIKDLELQLKLVYLEDF